MQGEGGCDGNRGIAREAFDTSEGAGVAAGVAENVQKEPGGTVDDCGELVLRWVRTELGVEVVETQDAIETAGTIDLGEHV